VVYCKVYFNFTLIILSGYITYKQIGRFIKPYITTEYGTKKLKDLTYFPCSCPICSKYTISELKKLEEKDKTYEIAKHNLYITYMELKKIKNAIACGNLWELVERRANSNPYLLEAQRELRKREIKEFLEKFEPTCKKKALFYTGCQTVHRPDVYRIHKRLLERYNQLYEKTNPSKCWVFSWRR